MSVRLFYVDESWNEEKICLSAFGVRHRDWQLSFDAVKAHRQRLKQEHGLYLRKEIHAHEFVSGRGGVAPHVIPKHTRARIYFGLLRLLASLPVRLFNICLDRKGRKDPNLDAWDRLLNRIERCMLEFDRKEGVTRSHLISGLSGNVGETYAKEIEDRLKVYSPRALIFVDKGHEVEMTRAYRKMHIYNPIPSRFGQWAAGKSKNIPIRRIIEDPVFRDSSQSFLIQLADCAAFALLKRETPPTPSIEKYDIHKFFDQCLPKICHTQASNTDPLGIVRN